MVLALKGQPGWLLSSLLWAPAVKKFLDQTLQQSWDFFVCLFFNCNRIVYSKSVAPISQRNWLETQHPSHSQVPRPPPPQWKPQASWQLQSIGHQRCYSFHSYFWEGKSSTQAAASSPWPDGKESEGQAPHFGRSGLEYTGISLWRLIYAVICDIITP